MKSKNKNGENNSIFFPKYHLYGVMEPICVGTYCMFKSIYHECDNSAGPNLPKLEPREVQSY